ncbi:MAG: type I-E CRISPR-associated protein Cas6/Cse3/CasE [Clostridiales Family XIII bacterium]|jgi:CRISPR system Cascade subunit CasE|nr:type I-E CRISPR-associated protein Cas6/Cse3/CasE [Clostridiales Family XIII bacterium]
MYLSRVEINKQRIETKRALMSPQIMHASIKACFPKSDGRILWRADTLGHNLYILIAAPIKPDFTDFIRQYGWPASGQTGESGDYGQLLDRITQDSVWRFRLTANPVHTVKGKIYAHVTAAHQRNWLLDRAECNGFVLQGDALDVVRRDTIRFHKGRGTERREVTLARASFEGVLTVRDAALFKNALTQGIGRARAYGCGLLTVARLL